MSKSIQITGASPKLYALHATICCDFTLAGEKHSVIVGHVGKSGAPASILAANSTDVLGCLETRVDEAVESYTDPNSDMVQKLRNSANQCCGMHTALDGFASSLADILNRAINEADDDDDDEIDDETETETPPVAEASTAVGDSDEEDVKEEEPEAPLTNVKFYFDIHELTEEGDLDIVTGSVLKTLVGLGDCCGDPENCQEGQPGCVNPDGTTQTAESTPTVDAGEPAIVG